MGRIGIRLAIIRHRMVVIEILKTVSRLPIDVAHQCALLLGAQDGAGPQTHIAVILARDEGELRFLLQAAMQPGRAAAGQDFGNMDAAVARKGFGNS